VEDAIDVSTQLVWRCCSWLPPQRRRTRRESAAHFALPPTSRRPHRWGFEAKPVWLRGGRCRKKSSMTSLKGIMSAKPWNLGSVSLSEGGKEWWLRRRQPRSRQPRRRPPRRRSNNFFFRSYLSRSLRAGVLWSPGALLLWEGTHGSPLMLTLPPLYERGPTGPLSCSPSLHAMSVA